jgi:membrane-associated phospholipid phosphatase
MAMPRGFSVPVLLSYMLDWIVIIVIAGIGGGLNFVKPFHRPFSLVNLDISYPFIDEIISTGTLIAVGLMAPACIIFGVVLLFVPGLAFMRKSNRSQIIRLKLWECEKGWAGLALSVAMAVFITQGMKNIFGKPRPDLLERCRPDLTNIAAHVVGGYGQDISSKWTLVSSSICTQTDASVLDDGFRSFPSGHSSWIWSGMLYLTLFLCSKFSIA